MRKLIKAVLLVISLVFLVYSILPSPDFPEPPADSLRSNEPADSETPLRRAYFVNLNRQEIMQHYQNQFRGYRLNYPPEEAQTIIRDQTRSTYLEEVVHPFRESIFVNGFEPSSEKDTIFIEDRLWEQKITVRYVSSSTLFRAIVAMLSLFATLVLAKELRNL